MKGKERSCYDAYLTALREVLNRHDPASLFDCGCPEDEYNPERDLIAPELPRWTDAAAAAAGAHAVFDRMFGGDVGEPEDYRDMADDLMQVRERFYKDGMPRID